MGSYFGINRQGHLEALVNPEHPIDQKTLYDDLAAQGLHPPLLLRFSDLLKRHM